MRDTSKYWLLALGVCCAGPIVLVLVAANASLVLGVVLDSWPAILTGLLLLIIGIVYYVRRRHRAHKRQ